MTAAEETDDASARAEVQGGGGGLVRSKAGRRRFIHVRAPKPTYLFDMEMVAVLRLEPNRTPFRRRHRSIVKVCSIGTGTVRRVTY